MSDANRDARRTQFIQLGTALSSAVGLIILLVVLLHNKKPEVSPAKEVSIPAKDLKPATHHDNDICNYFTASMECHCQGEVAYCDITSRIESKDWGKLKVNDNVTRLEMSYLYNDHVTSIFPSQIFLKLSVLRTVLVQHGNFDAIRKFSFQNHTLLASIHLMGNKIKHLEEYSIFNLPQLVKLDLSVNNIDVIDVNAFLKLPALKELFINHNLIQELKSNFFIGMGELRKLDVSNNRIKTIDSEAFAKLKKLEYISLDNNQLVKITDEMIPNHSPGLKSLELQSNRIDFISPQAFKNLTSLKSLNFFNNSVNSLDAEMFRPLLDVILVKFSSNKLKTLKKSWFTFLDLNHSQNLDLALEGNPLDCTCDLKWLPNVKNNKFQQNLKDVQCTITDNDYCCGATVGQNVNVLDYVKKYMLCYQTLIPTTPTTHTAHYSTAPTKRTIPDDAASSLHISISLILFLQLMILETSI